MDGSAFEEKSSFKMLQVTFSSKLDWGTYIISIAKTASKNIGVLTHSMKFLLLEVAPYLFLKKLGFTPCKAKQLLQRKKKKHKKIRAYRKYLWKESTPNRCLLILDLKPFRFYISQRKGFYRQIIQEYGCIRKETVDIDILVSSRSGHIKIKQSLRITRRPSL